ncbi:hypothetical protein [Actinoplanes sp. N902-109]|uniref:hypothetical protein n=1 Tax=Actinoplanes sp. (strain N902-109) TaxID=649831 RepID=UPI000329478F|nr:hypothetical protein [Actinoplanes sp. N902-109]AGL16306.1 hypothetical protein L083_2796 [Actinoplanes sp. N902-109]
MNFRTTGAALAISLGVLLTGCSSGDRDDTGDVASLTGAGSASSASSASPAATAEERPLIRTDTSAAEEDRLYALWQGCYKDHGFDPGEMKRAAATQEDGVAALTPERKVAWTKAEKDCANKQPEQVWERAKRLDPAYSDKLRDWITCIRAQGINAWESDGFVAYDSLPPDNELKKVDDCQDKAFGKG